MRDYQKSKVYKWEEKHVRPRMDTTPLPIEVLTTIANHMWTEMGLSNPPRIIHDENRKGPSTGSRYRVILSRTHADQHILTHELAHSLNTREDRPGHYDHHGPNYVADYCSLLVRFYGFDPFALIHTLKQSKVDINSGHLFASI